MQPDTALSLHHGVPVLVAAPAVATRRVLVSEVIQEVAARHRVSVEDLVGPARTKEIAHIRHEAMAEARRRTKASLPEIGRRFGGRDHTTVLYAVRAHERRMTEAQP